MKRIINYHSCSNLLYCPVGKHVKVERVEWCLSNHPATHPMTFSKSYELLLTVDSSIHLNKEFGGNQMELNRAYRIQPILVGVHVSLMGDSGDIKHIYIPCE